MLNFDDSVTKQIWERYIAICNREKSKGFIDYYNSLQRNAKGDNINSRKEKLSQSEKTMDIRYKNLTELKYNNTLYNSMTNDKYRKAISRWRLSSHKLYIEIGRYKIPKIDRYERLCCICDILEDEYHVLFVCRAHRIIRENYTSLLNKFMIAKDILNPMNIDDLKTIGSYILEIERNMESLKMTHWLSIESKHKYIAALELMFESS